MRRAQLLGYLAKPLRNVAVSDLQAYVATLDKMAPATIGLVVSASLRPADWKALE